LYIVWNVIKFDVHVLVSVHWCVEIEVGDVNAYELHTWVDMMKLKMQFGYDEVCGWCSNIAWEIYEVSANSQLCSVWF